MSECLRSCVNRRIQGIHIALEVLLYLQIFNSYVNMDPQTCMKCGSLPQDILMLSCNHDLCLRCASDRLRSDTRRKPTSTAIVCQICGARTQLDSQTLYELEKVANTSKLLNSSLRKDYKQNNYPKRGDSNPSLADARKSLNTLQNAPSKYSLNPKLPQQQSTYSTRRNQPSFSDHIAKPSVGGSSKRQMCSTHPEEQILYYCFQCNCECICPECVIHGEHKSHQVQTIKKSYPTIKTHINSYLQGINKNVDELTAKQNLMSREMQEMSSTTDQTKRNIQKQFNQIIDRAKAKEKQILAKCDYALHAVIQRLKANKQVLQERIKQRRDLVANIGACLLKDEFSVLNYYAKNNLSLESMAQRLDINELIPKKDKQLLKEQHISRQIQRINAQIDNLDIDESIDIDKQIGLGHRDASRQELSLQKNERASSHSQIPTNSRYSNLSVGNRRESVRQTGANVSVD